MGVYQCKKRLMLMYLLLCVTFLLELLPTMGIILPRALSSKYFLLLFFVISVIVLAKRHILVRHTLSTYMFCMCLYWLLITFMHIDYQQQSAAYFCSTIMYPWSVIIIVDSILGLSGSNNHYGLSCTCNSEDFIAEITKIFCPFVILYFIIVMKYRLDTFHVITGGGESAVYYVLTLLPLILCLKGKIKGVLLALCIISVFISFKRTALLALLISLFIYYGMSFLNKDNKKFKTFLRICLAIVLIYFVYKVIVSKTGNDIIAKLLESNDDGGSGRIDVYIAALTKFKESSFFDKLFGIGFNGVRYHYQIISRGGSIVTAHCDFIEVLCDYGIIGAVAYVGFIIKEIKLCIQLKRKNSDLAPVVGAAIAMLVVISAFSHLFLYPSFFAHFLIVFVFAEKVANEKVAY